MKKLFVYALLISSLAVFVSCGSSETTETSADNTATEAPADTTSETEGKYKDGVYTAKDAEPADNGYSDEVTITVENGLITEVVYNSFNTDGTDKYSASQPGGTYDMSVAGAQSAWYEQADLLCANLIETQDPNSINLDAEGHTDSVAGVSITVDGFVTLANQALADAVK